jgi:hypothetical protein
VLKKKKFRSLPLPWKKNQDLVEKRIFYVILFQILRKYDCKSYSVSGRESDRLLQCIIKRGADLEEVLKVVQLVEGLKKVT